MDSDGGLPTGTKSTRNSGLYTTMYTISFGGKILVGLRMGGEEGYIHYKEGWISSTECRNIMIRTVFLRSQGTNRFEVFEVDSLLLISYE